MSGVAGARRSIVAEFTPPTIAQAAFGGLCPRCGQPHLFAGPLFSKQVTTFAETCAACGLDFTRFNVGDGPAAFLTLILGTVVTIAAIAVELTLHPPLWLHMLIWLPLTAIGVVYTLRVAKGALVAAEYRNEAREGAVARPDADDDA
ncbi:MULTISPECIES: DUF983 domain-containing protein [unclassified Sphingomonas]|uniref:DUF983 domain-containing protein n=1 Tax=unclassified Sphingomonas TaxID=196159 RepID=UPI00286C4A96|nr:MULTISPECIES: DUF983 domain-containing protein [unclassified Sphingomonas]